MVVFVVLDIHNLKVFVDEEIDSLMIGTAQTLCVYRHNEQCLIADVKLAKMARSTVPKREMRIGVGYHGGFGGQLQLRKRRSQQLAGKAFLVQVQDAEDIANYSNRTETE